MCRCGITVAVLIVLICGAHAGAVDLDPNDFAVEVIAYVAGTGGPVGYDNPARALGRPTLLTKGDGFFIPPNEDVPVVPVSPAWRTEELVSIGNGGYLTVRFGHPVRNDVNNPYGIDFIVFGNANQVISGGEPWENGNPEDTTVSGGLVNEPGIVSVSQDGSKWYTFDPNSGPYADDFAATASYQWDRVNDVWAEELDPTRPVDPNLTAAGFAGWTVADIIDAYDGSAGGTGFDLEDVGLDWIRYVRIEDNPASSVTTEIDALADVSCCGDYRHQFPTGDVTQNCRVDVLDLAEVCRHWLEESGTCQRPVGDVSGDGRVDLLDVLELNKHWLECSWDCQ